jgi:two-component system, cell cycle response regulator
MSESEIELPRRSVGVVTPDLMEAKLRGLDRRQWWLWTSAFCVMVLLTIAVASFATPAILKYEAKPFSSYLGEAVRALLGIVLVFNVYAVYQQVTINRMRVQMARQVKSIEKVETLAAEVYKLAAIDPLTGLYNRRLGEQRLEEEVSRASRHGRPLTLLLLDLDGLKKVNDSRGHQAGDVLITAFSERLKRAIRGSDLAARMGGDEFMVILPECRPDEVKHVVRRLEGITAKFEADEVPVRFSAGYSDYRDGETSTEFMKRTDDALYADKRGGHTEQVADYSVAIAERRPRA